MSTPYEAFYVMTYGIEPGKMPQALELFDRVAAVASRMPGVESVRTYVTQFNLGWTEHSVEMWVKVEDYSALDRWDEVSGQLRTDWSEVNSDATGVVRAGPARLMGDLKGSVPTDQGGSLGA